jgi:uncharacterized protein YuzE
LAHARLSLGGAARLPLVRVVYDPQADAAMVYVLDGVAVDHWDVAEDGLVLGLTSDGRLAQCELWSVSSAGFEDYKALPVG